VSECEVSVTDGEGSRGVRVGAVFPIQRLSRRRQRRISSSTSGWNAMLPGPVNRSARRLRNPRASAFKRSWAAARRAPRSASQRARRSPSRWLQRSCSC
jgi:hypothetical protein